MERSSTSSSSASLPRTASTSTSTTPRSRRSNINLADLRLSPLSTRYTELTQTLAPSHGSTVHSSLGTQDLAYSASNHGSYLANRSAPTTPGILSRSSSKRSLASAGGLRRSSRRNSLHDHQDPEAGAQNGMRTGEISTRNFRTVGGTDFPKAKSEAALLVHRSRALRTPNLEARQRSHPGTAAGRRNHSRRATGDPTLPSSGTPRAAAASGSRSGIWDQEWLFRTGLATSAAVRGSKGRPWLAESTYHGSSSHLQDTTDEDNDDEVRDEDEAEDEGYEELAALSSTSTSTSSRRRRGGQHAVQAVKGAALAASLAGLSTARKKTSASASAWGSRYGSRDPSRRGSRRGSTSTSNFNSNLTLTSLSGLRTPVPAAAAGVAGSIADRGGCGEGRRRDYFEDAAYAMSLRPRFLDGDGDGEGDDESSADEILSPAHTISLTDARSFGLGGLVDRIMGFGSLFNLEESGGETTGTEESEGETVEQGRERLKIEAARRRQEKARLSLRKAGEDGEGDRVVGNGGGDGKGGWRDAAWLLSVAGRAIWSDVT